MKQKQQDELLVPLATTGCDQSFLPQAFPGYNHIRLTAIRTCCQGVSFHSVPLSRRLKHLAAGDAGPGPILAALASAINEYQFSATTTTAKHNPPLHRMQTNVHIVTGRPTHLYRHSRLFLISGPHGSAERQDKYAEQGWIRL